MCFAHSSGHQLTGERHRLNEVEPCRVQIPVCPGLCYLKDANSNSPPSFFLMKHGILFIQRKRRPGLPSPLT